MARQYHQFCGVARALDVVGERWTLLLVRDLLLGPLRFSDLLLIEAGIGPNLLTKRLKHLEAEGVLQSRLLGAPSRAKVYELTEWGYSLKPVVLALGRFGAPRLGVPDAEDRMEMGWAMFSLQRRFTETDRLALIDISVDDQTYSLRMQPGALQVERGESRSPDLRISGSLPGFHAWILGHRRWPELVESKIFDLEGDADALRALSKGLGL